MHSGMRIHDNWQYVYFLLKFGICLSEYQSVKLLAYELYVTHMNVFLRITNAKWWISSADCFAEVKGQCQYLQRKKSRFCPNMRNVCTALHRNSKRDIAFIPQSCRLSYSKSHQTNSIADIEMFVCHHFQFSFIFYHFFYRQTTLLLSTCKSYLFGLSHSSQAYIIIFLVYYLLSDGFLF